MGRRGRPFGLAVIVLLAVLARARLKSRPRAVVRGPSQKSLLMLLPDHALRPLIPPIWARPLVWRRSKPVTKRQGGSGVHLKVETKPFVWSVYYRLIRISLVWSDTTSYATL